MSKVVLITGANRGIGKGFVTYYLARPNTTVIAAVRHASSEQAKELHTLKKGNESHLIIVSLDANSAASAAHAASEIQIHHHINHIDIVIANAGICNSWVPVLEVDESDMYTHFEVNAMGPLRLFQAMAPLLQKARRPKFVYISTQLASIAGIGQTSSMTVAYGISKAAGNYLVRKIHAENEHLIALSFDPGLVQTDMGGRAAQSLGLDEAPVTIEETVRGITKQIDTAEKSTTSGGFFSYHGERVAWYHNQMAGMLSLEYFNPSHYHQCSLLR